ncbi:MAG: FtsX-like permease family protein [Candidatus Bathyarchaeota archaeon]|nr:MAG: FtsX-like permease family protein [Candidatus Bathyarchaeota archaeon]
MSEVVFPIKDLTRRKLQTSLVIVGLTISTAATVFLTIFGENLGFEIAFVTGGKLTAGFSSIFSRFIIVVDLLNIVAGAVIVSFLVSIMMSERVRDIGVMKAIGCLRNTVLSYFLTELSIIVLTSCIIGTICGILANFACIHLLNALGFSIAQKSLNLWMILLIFITFVIISHVFGVRPIVKAIRVKPAEALSPLYSFGTIPELSRYSPSKLGFTFKMAFRSLLRRRLPTQQAIICLAAVLALVSVTIVGGIIANQTTQNYVRRAIGKNVVLISHPDVSEQYVKFLSQFFEANETGSIDYLNPNYAISETLVSRLSIIPGVQKVDPRLILETTIYEVPGVIIDPERPDDPYTSVGDHRSSSALVLGINPESTISDWLILGRTLNETDLYSALIGDSLAIKSFDSPEVQSFRMLKQSFDIAGVCLDPLDNGDVVYVPFEALSKLVNQTVCNVLLLEIDPSNRSEILSKIREICGTNLKVLELEGTLEKHLSFLNLLWSSIMLLPLFSLVTATICLISYMMLNITGQQREFGIMRAIGAKPKAVIKMIFTQALIVTLVSGAIGILAGFFVTFVFLIPDPVISYFTIILIVGWLLIALSCLSLASLYPAVRTVKKSVASTLSQ